MRADRLLTLMLLLHARKQMTAQALAAALEVSERTIYRDVDALAVAGVPVYTQSGPNGGVFLDENYRISLTGLTPPEVQSLFLGHQVGPMADLGLAKAVEDTLLKLLAALPRQQRDEAERVRQRFFIDPTNWFQILEPSSVFPSLQTAVTDDRRIDVVYRPVEGPPSPRRLDAYGLVSKANIWYLVARKTDGDYRSYRVSRFEQVTLCSTRFSRDPAFDLAHYWREACASYEQLSMESMPPYPATLSVAPAAQWYFGAYMAGRYEQLGPPDADGWVRLRVTFESIHEGAMRALGLGSHVRVVEPDALRALVVDTAREVLDFYGNAKG